jgi:heme-degrading monooxygenase HmoA
MFASIRRYRLQQGEMDELTRRVDTDFAEQISAKPGFVAYEFVDCGDGELMTISIFEEEQDAESSRELAHRWTEERLTDLEFTRTEPLRGEVKVSRAAEHMLEPGHTGMASRFCSFRRYSLRGGDVDSLVHKVDTSFADRVAKMDGFEAYHVLDCGRGEILSITLCRDQACAESSDEMALTFVRDELGDFDIERTEALGGEAIVSRAMAMLLEPAHA